MMPAALPPGRTGPPDVGAGQDTRPRLPAATVAVTLARRPAVRDDHHELPTPSARQTNVVAARRA